MYNRVFVAIAATDISQTIDFYSKLLQLEPEKYIPNVYAEFNFPQFAIAIFQPSANNLEEFNNSRGSGMSICLEVEDLDKAIAFLAEIGYPTSGDIMTASHGREIYAYDPSGNRLILYQKN